MDKKWEQPSNRNSTTFTRLPAGKFKFQVIARNDEGVWNDVGASLDIVVKPFFWETWWFKIGGAALTVLATGGFVFLNLKQKHRHQLQRLTAKRALEQERSRIARDIHDDLGASLTRISLLSQNPPTAECAPVFEQIQNTARHLMRSMNEVVWAINPEHDTFDDLANYLSSYAQDFLSVAGIRCRLELPMDLPEQTLSSQLQHNLFLAFKEALNNAVKHAKASEVRISIETSDDALTLRVSDNGGGIDTSATAEPGRPTAGNGLVNMKSRMEEIGGTCVVNSCADDGTSIEFHVPFSSSS
jgi:signal transduction histidine kinase